MNATIQKVPTRQPPDQDATDAILAVFETPERARRRAAGARALPAGHYQTSRTRRAAVRGAALGAVGPHPWGWEPQPADN